MPSFGRRGTPALLVATFFALPASAAAQGACAIEEGRPAELARATLALTLAGTEKANKQLRDAVKAVGEQGAKIDNQAGRNLVLGKLLLAWHGQPGITSAVTRGDIGYTSNKTAPIDLLAAADSALSAVEKSNPECAAEIAEVRRGDPWRASLQAAIAAHGAGQLDSAEILTRRSMVIDRTTPYPYQLLADIAQQRHDTADAIRHWREVLAAAGKDSIYEEPRRQANYNLGGLLGGLAEGAKGAEQAKHARESAEYYRAYLAGTSENPEDGGARNRLADMLTLAGDTAAIPSVYADLLANPARYNDMHLVQAGVIAVKADRSADASKLFAAALERNPHDRDALTNLAASYYGSGEFAKMPPVIERLVALDPNNPDALTLYVYAYSGLAKAEKSGPKRKAFTDSLVAYNDRVEKMPTVLRVTQFARGSARAVLSGSIENRSKATKSFNVAFEFLDKDGKVVTTQDVAVDGVAAGASKEFSVTVPQGGIVAFRYKPIT